MYITRSTIAVSFESTYKELKSEISASQYHDNVVRFESTYKELKYSLPRHNKRLPHPFWVYL